MIEKFRALGVSFKSTPFEIREAISLDEQAVRVFLKRSQEVLGLEELLIISTCNRTEIYYLAEKDYREDILALLSIQLGSAVPFKSYFRSLDGSEAVEHLFEVSLGLDSMVLGDIQISNQVKKAYQWSADEGLAGPFLHRLMHTIFFTNKRVVQETSFRDGNASVASVTVELVKQFSQNFQRAKVAVIGLGEIGSDVAENLEGFEADICLLNRSRAKAEELAHKYQYQVRDIGELTEIANEVDVIISAISVQEVVINKEMLQGVSYVNKMFVDLAVPRSIDHGIESIPGVILYNIDHLQDRAKKVAEKRSKTIPQVRAILSEAVTEFNNWSQEMEISPTIQKLKKALEDIRQAELARYLGRVDADQEKLLDQVTKNLVQKMIKLPVLQLKAACQRGEAETLLDVLNDLFNLEKPVKVRK